VVLEDLSEFFEGKRASLIAKLAVSKTPDEAFEVSCEYRALMALIREAEAAASVGRMAAEELMKE
jgi:hypothetical protein